MHGDWGSMNHEQFLRVVVDELGEAGLEVTPVGRTEHLELRHGDRKVALELPDFGRERDEVLTCWTTVEWTWRALQSARAATTEEDVLVELFGHRSVMPETEPGAVRVDVTLKATAPWGSNLTLPDSATWARWSAAVHAALEPLLGLELVEGEDGQRRVVGGWESPVVELACDAAGHLTVSRLEARAFELVDIPRVWDDSRRPPDPDPRERLADLARRLVEARTAWREALGELSPHGLKPS
jgi:hypothetical protein